MESLILTDYNCYVEYFKDFYNFNKEKYSYFSHVYFSKQTKWPNSLLGDIINKRRALTLNRAIQFCDALNFNETDTEYFVFLVLKQSPNNNVSTFFTKYLSNNYDKKIDIPLEVDTAIFKDIDYLAVYELTKWARKKLDPKIVCDLLELRSNLDEKKVLLIYKRLEEYKIVKFLENSEVQILVENLILSIFGKKQKDQIQWLLFQYAENYKNYFSVCTFPHRFFSSTIELPMDHIDDIFDRFVMTRNWLHALSRETTMAKKEKLDDTLLFQLDMNIFPIISKGKIKDI